MARHLDKRTANVGITAAMKEPLYTDKKFIIYEFPRIGYPGTVFMPTNVVPTIAPKGGHLLESSIICEYEIFRERERLFKTVELMKQDVDDLFPRWQEKAIWIKPYFHWEEPARNPGREGIFRPGPKAPRIKGLYFTGDSVNSRALSGMECAADSAMICVQAILGRIPG
jgi:phytoene dehydrogenase-like protein